MASSKRSFDIPATAGVIAVFIELVLAAVLMRDADMFTPAFRRVFYLAAAAFLVHHHLPLRHRLTAFTMLCGAALLVILGGSPAGVWDPRLAVERVVPLVGIGIGLALIAAARMPMWLRTVLLIAAAGGLALFRAGLVGTPALIVIWPVLAGFVMFRLIVYAYDRATATTPSTRRGVLAYLFLFPNGAFGLFPVVDFKTFTRSHYDSDAVAIYQRGAHWIVRGLSHLLLYRVVQQLFAVPPQSVANGTDLIQFILANSFLYLKVSGQFHLFVGLLLLFGFNLPETNRRYFLAASFTDYWRRVNIYWKDFVLKIFYYPLYFRLRARGDTFALVCATLWAFFATWALHLYQTWWLTGTASLSWPDTLFWFTLALLVLGNSLWEAKRGRRRTLGATPRTVRSDVALAGRTAATFACISLLWSLWSTPSLSQWVHLWTFADVHTAAWAAAALMTIMLATLMFEARPATGRLTRAATLTGSGSLLMVGRRFAQSAVPLLVMCAVSAPTVQARFDVAALQPLRDAINTGDSLVDELAVRNGGYYENLTAVDAANAQLWETLMRQRMAVVYHGPDPVRPVQDFRFRELLPNVDLEAYDTEFQTNRWGMRDQDYSLAKPARTFRIALLGSSHVVGWGVPKDEIFESILERRLNTEHPEGRDHVRFEVLNFAVNGLSPLGELSVLDRRVPAFHPDLVLFVTHPIDYRWVGRDLPRSLRQNVPIPFDFLTTVLREARVTARTHDAIAAERLRPYEPAVLGWSYQRIAERLDHLGIPGVAVFLLVPNDLPMTPRRVQVTTEQAGLIARSGLIPLDLSHLFEGMDPGLLSVNEPLRHSNARAHALIADALYARLLHDPAIDLPRRARRILRTEPSVVRASTGDAHATSDVVR